MTRALDTLAAAAYMAIAFVVAVALTARTLALDFARELRRIWGAP